MNFLFRNGRNAHQPQTEAANAARAHVMRGSVACCFERPEQLQNVEGYKKGLRQNRSV